MPSRYSLVFVLFAVAMTASVWRTMSFGATAEARRFGAVALILASCGIAHWNRMHFEGVFSLAPLRPSFQFLGRPGPPAVDMETEGLAQGQSPMLRAAMENRAVFRCYEPLHLPGGIDPTRAVVFPEGSARIADVVFAPGRIAFRALTGGTPGRVFLNERYVRGWQSDAGPMTVEPQSGLAYVTLPPGTTGRFTFRFVPPRLTAGLALLALGIAAAWALRGRALTPPSMVQFSHVVR